MPFFTRTQIPYALLLEKREWLNKRQQICSRDGFRCTSCGRQESDDVHLQVHHRYYISGLDPWEYRDSVLVTLCENCHRVVHELTVVHSYELRGNDLVEIGRKPCKRCNGAGYFPEYQHVQNGICFRCYGERFEESIVSIHNYAAEHDINLSEFQDGFEELTPEEYAKIASATVMEIPEDENRFRVRIVYNNGMLVEWPLDYSVFASPGDRLKVSSLRIKEYRSLGRRMIIIKGEVIR